MRTSPLIHTFIILCCLGVALIPLMRLTGETGAGDSLIVQQQVKQAGSKETSMFVTIRFVHAPEFVFMKFNDEILWESGDERQLEYDFELNRPISNNGFEAALHVKWPRGTPRTIAEIEIAPEGHESQSVTVWGQDELTEYLRFEIP